MARPLWTGNISFGLVTIPVDMHSATRDRDIHFHLVTPDGKCRLRQKLHCPESGKEYDFSQTARGYEIAPEQYVIVDKDEMKALQPESGHQIEIEKFVALNEVDPIYFNNSYILTPGKRGEKPYALLREALQRSERAAIAHLVMRQRQYLAIIREMENALILETMLYNDELKDLSEFSLPSAQTKLAKKEIDLALQLIESLTDKFRAADYHNQYREKMRKMLESMAKGQKVKTPKAAKTGAKTNVVNLMDRLTASLKEQKHSAGKTKAHSAPRKKRAAGGRR